MRVTNSNSLLVKNFYLFIKKFLPQVFQKTKMYLVLYPDLNDCKCKEHWSKMVGVPLDRFYKSQYIKGRSAKRILLFGVGTLIVSSRAYKEMIIHWLELRKKEISLVRV